MNSGKLRHRVVIQQLTETAGEFNQPGETYTTWKQGWWARIRPINGNELQVAGATQTELSHVVEVRYCKGLNEKHRIKWIDPAARRIRYFNVKAVITPDEIPDEMQLQCLEDKSREETA